MAYWWYGVKEVIEILKEKFNHIPIILGGIYATLYKEHAQKNIEADFVYEGHVDKRLIEVVENFGLKLKKK